MHPAPDPRSRQLLSPLGAALLVVVGAALGLWLFLDELRKLPGGSGALGDDAFLEGLDGGVFFVLVVVLGGVSLVLLPWTFLARRRGRKHPRRARLGEFLAMIHGIAAWLLWPPMIHVRLKGERAGGAMTSICFVYGTPLMALFVALGLLGSGWLRPRRRPAGPLDALGLLLGLLWACTGLYLLSLLYFQHFRKP